MSDIAIRIAGLSKQYRIGRQEKNRTFREMLTDAITAPFRRTYGLLRGNAAAAANLSETIWALKDISFEVKKGEVVGIIGRNGAGKSTLLKILSRITEPTKGTAKIFGRVGSLLEVGTGFHFELTGRENIYLNGAILGMSREEIKRKFDEIVAFAEVEKFIDTPVKHYSSGMGLRLGFAVAAHLEPEILIVDEVLAVGDAQFQKKCLTKMQEIGRGGRTILFVSHNMSAVRNICQSGLILEGGQIVGQGETNVVIDTYLARVAEETTQRKIIETESFIVNEVRICSIHESVIKTFRPVEIRVCFTAKTDIIDPGLYVGILTMEGIRLAGLDFKDFDTIQTIHAGQQAEMGFLIDSFPLLPGSYQLEIYLKDMSSSSKIELMPRLFTFEIVETPIYGGRKMDRWFGSIGLNARAFVEPAATPMKLVLR